ncbi:MAG: SPOR domain-containing protein [Parvibaculum sp.]|uniref:SPOR domain-containing protein n=1 Tax=Parvibaculum sp. TaxID=2024848 RepID=UPI0025EA371C|nr:SPOR domain-containing protein [Parvibaculum sp.]MCE9648255.1 SPOR domain-containing protein [Parvibaculum sp.]
MSKKPASLTSDLLARKGEAEPSTIDPADRMTLSAGPGFSAYGGGGGRDGDDEGEEARPRPPEPEIIYTAEETGGGGGSTRLIVGAVLGLIIVGGIFLVMTGKEGGVAPVSPDITAQAPEMQAPATPETQMPVTPESAAPETLTTVPAAPGQSTAEAPAPSAPGSATNSTTPSAPADLRPTTPVEGAPVESAPQAPAVPPVASVEVPSAPVQAAKPVEEAAPAEKPAAVAAKPSSKGAYVVQLFALKDEAAARASWAKLTKKHGDVLSGHALDVEKADLGDKGTWYRVRAAGFATKAAANSACSKLKASGQDCMVKKR